jgi:hypothetical protein
MGVAVEVAHRRYDIEAEAPSPRLA